MPDSEEKVENGQDNMDQEKSETKERQGAGQQPASSGSEQKNGTDTGTASGLEDLVPGNADEPAGNGEPAEIDMLMDVDVNVSIELGRTVRSIEEILKLAPGRIIELDRPAGENVDMYLNGKLFARGEVTVIDENYAVRVTEIVKAKQ